jgi:hypothetical protein
MDDECAAQAGTRYEDKFAAWLNIQSIGYVRIQGGKTEESYAVNFMKDVMKRPDFIVNISPGVSVAIDVKAYTTTTATIRAYLRGCKDWKMPPRLRYGYPCRELALPVRDLIKAIEFDRAFGTRTWYVCETFNGNSWWVAPISGLLENARKCTNLDKELGEVRVYPVSYNGDLPGEKFRLVADKDSLLKVLSGD